MPDLTDPAPNVGGGIRILARAGALIAFMIVGIIIYRILT